MERSRIEDMLMFAVEVMCLVWAAAIFYEWVMR